MDIAIQQLPLRDYAELQTRFGVKIVEHNGRFWCRIRPFFYRPLLPFEECDPSTIASPVKWPSGFQYVVSKGLPANSTMNFLMLDDLQNYSLLHLNHKRRHIIKTAAMKFQVRRLTDPRDLREHGHKVYLSFYLRTRYAYKSDRIKKAVFNKWVDCLFSDARTIVLGGFGPQGLGAIATCYWVNTTLVWSTLICETEALRGKLGELMFHEFRLLAAQQSTIKEIFVRNYQGGNSLDHYYMLRGCHLVRKPAHLEIPSPVQTLIRWVMPKKYALLNGDD
jgi:hypothetical protein